MILSLAIILGTVGCKSSEALNKEGARLVDLKRDYEGGKQLFWQAIEKDVTNYKAHKNLAFVLAKEKKYDEAIVHLEKAIEFKPDYANAHINLSLLYSEQEEYGKAIEHMDAAVDNGFPVDLNYRNFLQGHR